MTLTEVLIQESNTAQSIIRAESASVISIDGSSITLNAVGDFGVLDLDQSG